jgi:hypothetical protein
LNQRKKFQNDVVISEKKASVKKPGIFYHAKITTVNPIHTCGMCSTRDMIIAAQRTGHLVVNVAGMKDILLLVTTTGSLLPARFSIQ